MSEISRRQIAEWICDLNSWEWPADVPKPHDGEITPERVSAFMRVLQSVIPYEEWIGVWQERHRGAWMNGFIQRGEKVQAR